MGQTDQGIGIARRLRQRDRRGRWLCYWSVPGMLLILLVLALFTMADVWWEVLLGAPFVLVADGGLCIAYWIGASSLLRRGLTTSCGGRISLTAEADRLCIADQYGHDTIFAAEITRAIWYSDENWEQIRGIEDAYELHLRSGEVLRIPGDATHIETLRPFLGTHHVQIDYVGLE